MTVTLWQHHAACRYEDPELFFPIGTAGPALEAIDKAKAVCRGCPVREQCLELALSSGQDSGVWGGLTPTERRVLKARAAAKQ
jgi:WhiB family redox-sensing transcriptional regulator